MKLTKVEKQLPSAQVNVTLSGKLKSEIDRYAAYYQHVHGEAIGIRKLIVEMLRNFVERPRLPGLGQAQFQQHHRYERQHHPFICEVRLQMSVRIRCGVRSVDALRAFWALTYHSSPR